MLVRRGWGVVRGTDKSCRGWQPNGTPRASSRCEACGEAWRSAGSRSRDAEYTEYVAARLPSLRELAAVLCGDWQRADDLVQATLLKLYVRWGPVGAARHPH